MNIGIADIKKAIDSVSDCALWRIYSDYKGEAQKGREDADGKA